MGLLEKINPSRGRRMHLTCTRAEKKNINENADHEAGRKPKKGSGQKLPNAADGNPFGKKGEAGQKINSNERRQHQEKGKTKKQEGH